MADESGEDAEDEEPAVELGEGERVEGAPIARVASRLTWGLQKSEIDRREGDVTVRTPDGPRELSELLDAIDDTYFTSRRHFVSAVRGVYGDGPIPTAEGSDGAEATEE